MCTVATCDRLFGNYEALDGGELSEALEDFTGGVSDTIDLPKMEVALKVETRVAFFARMLKDMERRSLMAASIPVSSNVFLIFDSGVVPKSIFVVCS